jgi:hypothetical protein
MSRYRLAGMATVAILAGLASQPIVGTAYANDFRPIRCDVGAKIDGSVAADARRKMNVAGYMDVSELKKGCDNYWHGMAVKDGVATHVLLAPQGRVQSEGN